jgi:hypothetical protein
MFIPYVDCDTGQKLGQLIWRDGAMQAWTATDELIGEFPTRREAASALFRTLDRGRRIRWTSHPERLPKVANPDNF